MYCRNEDGDKEWTIHLYKNRQGLVLDCLSVMNICSEGKLIECCKFAYFLFDNQ